MPKQIDKTKLFNQLKDLFADTNIDDVSAEGAGYTELPDGYYLCELTQAQLTESKSSGDPMARLDFKICEDGLSIDEKGKFHNIEKMAGRKFAMFYSFKDESAFKRFVSDMLKFEGEQAGVPLLEKKYFMQPEILDDALGVLVGSRIYVMVSTSTYKNQQGEEVESHWKNLISWKRVAALQLPQ